MKTKPSQPKIECCEECFKWGKKYGEYLYPCHNINCKCHKSYPDGQPENQHCEHCIKVIK
jgi:hypothetical protein